MKRKTHLIGAILFAFLGYFIWIYLQRAFISSSDPSIQTIINSISSMEISFFFIMIASSLLGGVLPDWLDPPLTRHHRFVAHSRILLYFLIIIWVVLLMLILIENSLPLFSIYFLVFGYISHLLLDSLTPAGLQ